MLGAKDGAGGRFPVIFWFIAIAALACWGIRLQRHGFREDFLSADSAAMLNGISILLVFTQHLGHVLLARMGYGMDGFGDAAYKSAVLSIQQLLVVSFLFFSGFGVMEQIGKRGESYVAEFPRRRIFRVWVNFAAAVCVFAAVHLVFRTGVPLRRMVASLTCFRSINNPSWYVFCILWCYASTYVAVRLSRGRGKFAKLCLIGFFTAAYIALICWMMPKKPWWYNTVMAYPFGAAVSLCRERIFGFIRKWYWPCLALSAAVFIWIYNFHFERYGLRHNALSCAFIALVVILTMKVRVGNPVLHWCGRHVFPIYMYHCLFFLLARCLYHGAMTPFAAHVIVALTLLPSLVLAHFYHHFEIRP